MLPDGHTVLFAVGGASAGIAVQSLNGGMR
jgi:hypothetical protein